MIITRPVFKNEYGSSVCQKSYRVYFLLIRCSVRLPQVEGRAALVPSGRTARTRRCTSALLRGSGGRAPSLDHLFNSRGLGQRPILKNLFKSHCSPASSLESVISSSTRYSSPVTHARTLEPLRRKVTERVLVPSESSMPRRLSVA